MIDDNGGFWAKLLPNMAPRKCSGRANKNDHRKLFFRLVLERKSDDITLLIYDSLIKNGANTEPDSLSGAGVAVITSFNEHMGP